MILTVGVEVTLEQREGQFSEVWDARVLVAAHAILKARPGVVAVEMHPEDTRAPVFVVAFDLQIGDSVTGYLGSLSDSPFKILLAYEEDGGWKQQLLALQFSVVPL